jgi:hypothetical protein
MPSIQPRAPKDESDASASLPSFSEFDVVALLDPWPAVGLDAGVWGNVLTVLPDEHYEIEFTDRDGAPLMMLRVPGGRLELVWADPG